VVGDQWSVVSKTNPVSLIADNYLITDNYWALLQTMLRTNLGFADH
jgi:hypothetical protein